MRDRLMVVLATLTSVLMLAASGGWWVWRAYYAEDQLLSAVDKANNENVKTLLIWGAPPNACDKEGSTLLHLSIGDSTRLISNRAEDRGRVAPTVPLKVENVELVRMLLAAGANKAVLDPDGRTPLQLARSAGHTKIVDLLKTYGTILP